MPCGRGWGPSYTFTYAQVNRFQQIRNDALDALDPERYAEHGPIQISVDGGR
jgi:hypothetical protein